MSSRTDVFLSILVIHQSRVKEIVNKYGYNGSWGEDQYVDSLIIQGRFPEISYATLPFLPELKEGGIPFNTEWGSYGDMGGGSQFCRYTADGELDFKEIADDEWDSVSLSSVEYYLADPLALHKYVKEQRKRLTVLPWDNQEEYGLKYVALQLIRPKENKYDLKRINRGLSPLFLLETAHE